MNEDAIKKGRALVKAIAALMALDELRSDIDSVEAEGRGILVAMYRKELRRLFGELTTDQLASLLTSGPQELQVDVCLN